MIICLVKLQKRYRPEHFPNVFVRGTLFFFYGTTQYKCAEHNTGKSHEAWKLINTSSPSYLCRFPSHLDSAPTNVLISSSFSSVKLNKDVIRLRSFYYVR